jgi:hypothetical protein
LAKDFVVTPPADPFRDVEVEHWAYEAVENLRARGLLEGWGARFHGRRTFSRYEMAEILARYSEKLEQARARLEATPPPPKPTLKQRLAKLRARHISKKPGPFTRLLEGSGVAKLEKQVKKIAAMVATHQTLLEEPEAQPGWRHRLGVTHSRPHRDDLNTAPASPRPSSPSPRTRMLLSALDDLSRGVNDSPPRRNGPSSRDRLRAILNKHGSSKELIQEDLRQTGKARYRSMMTLARTLRKSASPPPRPLSKRPSSSPQKQERSQDLRLLAALQEVRSGRLDPARAQAIVKLASLALKAPASTAY